MSRPLKSIAILGVAAYLAGNAPAGPTTAPQPADAAPVADNSSLVTAKLLDTTDTVQPGSEVVLLLQVHIAEGWHTYWAGSSDTGYPLKPEWSLPAGWKVVKTQWPVPHRLAGAGDILDHVYDKQATLVVTLQAPKDAKPGSAAPISVDVAWLACMEACIPGHAQAKIVLKVAEPGVTPIATNLDAQMAARAALPVEHKPGDFKVFKSTLDRTADGWRFTIKAGRAERIRFYPGPECATLPKLLEEGDRAGTESVLSVEAKEGATPRVQGIVQIVYPNDPETGKPGRVAAFSVDTADPATAPASGT